MLPVLGARECEALDPNIDAPHTDHVYCDLKAREEAKKSEYFKVSPSPSTFFYEIFLCVFPTLVDPMVC